MLKFLTMLIPSLQVCHGENTCPLAPAAMPVLGGARRPLLHSAKEALHPPSGRRSLPMKALSSMTMMNCHARRRWVPFHVILNSSPANYVTTARSKQLGFDVFRVEVASLLVENSAFLGVFRRSLLLLTLYFYNQHIFGHCKRFVAVSSRPPPGPTTHTAEVWINIICLSPPSRLPRELFKKISPSRLGMPSLPALFQPCNQVIVVLVND